MYSCRLCQIPIEETVKAKDMLSSDWFYGFMKRWTQLKTVNTQKFGLQRAKMASKDNIDHNFDELGSLLNRHIYLIPQIVSGMLMSVASQLSTLPQDSLC